MIDRTRRFIAIATTLSLLLSVPGLPAYAATATVARGAFSATPSISIPGNYAPAALTPMTATSLSVSPMIMPSLSVAAVPAAVTIAPAPVQAVAASPIMSASLPSAHTNDSDRTTRLSSVFDGNVLRTAIAADDALPNDPRKNGTSSEESRLAPAASAAAKDIDAGFTPATVIVAALEKLARTDPEQGYKRAVELLEDRATSSRQPKQAALRVLAALPISRTLPYYVQFLKSAAADESTKAEWGSKALYFIQRAILLRLAQEPQALKDSPEAMAAVRDSYQDGNGAVRLAAAEALKNAGVEPGPERADSIVAPSPAETVEKESPNVMTGLLSRLGKMSTMKKWVVGIVAATLLGLGGTAHFISAPYNPPNTPPAIVSVQPATPAPAVPAKIVPPAKTPVQTPPAAKVKTPEQVKYEILAKLAQQTEDRLKAKTPQDISSERQARAQEEILSTLKDIKAQAAAPKASSGQMGTWTQLIGIVLGFYLIQAVIKYFLAKKNGNNGNVPKDIADKGKAKFNLIKPGEMKVKFSDVEGIDESLIESSEVVEFLRNPGKFKRMGAHAPKGLLMYGEPGTGKTLTAQAIAGEAGAAFLSMSGADFTEMFVGVGASRVRDLIDAARKNKPAIIFIDEIDAVGKKRGGFNANDEREGTLNALLVAMDGFDNSGGIIFIGATNRVDTLDPALTRPGRFDRKVHVGLPTMGGREAILAIHAADKRLSPQLDLGYVARRTTGLAGADLANIMNEAALLAQRRNADAIEMRDIDRAIDRATFGDEMRLPVPDDVKRQVAYHEAGHVLASLLNEDPALRQKVNKFTMIPHSNGSLGLAEFDSSNSFMQSRAQLEARIDMALGGLVAEKLVFGTAKPIPGQWSTGPSNDLEQATKIAKAMVQSLGMGRTTGLVVTAPGEQDYGKNPFGDRIGELVWKEVGALLDASYKRVTARLTRNRHVLDALTAAVIEKETLMGAEVQEAIDRAHPVMKAKPAKKLK